VADPASLTVIRYTPLRPFLLRLNDTGGGVDDLLPRPAVPGEEGKTESDAVIGGGAGSAAAAHPPDAPTPSPAGVAGTAPGTEG
jgi:hypothetical protein